MEKTKKQLFEDKVRKIVKEELMTEAMTETYTIVKTFNGQHNRDIATYFDQNLANKICKILQANAKNENYSETIKYVVEVGKSASPVKR